MKSPRLALVPAAAMLCGAAVSVLLLFAGCGGPDGPARFELSGTVTYGGQPVPAGEVAFEPDAAKGNAGPASYAQIQKGRYTTQPSKGTVGGPHVVRITGMDGMASGELPEGRMLFFEYTTTAELPKQDSTRDFDVPGSHK